MRTFKEILEDEFGECDTTGICEEMVNGEVEEYDVVNKTADGSILWLSVRFAGWNNPLTHPALRNPRKEGWFDFEFATDGDGWYFYDFR